MGAASLAVVHTLGWAGECLKKKQLCMCTGRRAGVIRVRYSDHAFHHLRADMGTCGSPLMVSLSAQHHHNVLGDHWALHALGSSLAAAVHCLTCLQSASHGSMHARACVQHQRAQQWYMSLARRLLAHTMASLASVLDSTWGCAWHGLWPTGPSG